MKLEDAVATACKHIPELLHGALVFLPGGFALARASASASDELEPLVRATVRALGHDDAADLVECVFVVDERLVVIHRGARDPRLALAVTCGRDHNLGFALATSRVALREIEESFDFAAWGLG